MAFVAFVLLLIHNAWWCGALGPAWEQELRSSAERAFHGGKKTRKRGCTSLAALRYWLGHQWAADPLKAAEALCAPLVPFGPVEDQRLRQSVRLLQHLEDGDLADGNTTRELWVVPTRRPALWLLNISDINPQIRENLRQTSYSLDGMEIRWPQEAEGVRRPYLIPEPQVFDEGNDSSRLHHDVCSGVPRVAIESVKDWPVRPSVVVLRTALVSYEGFLLFYDAESGFVRLLTTGSPGQWPWLWLKEGWAKARFGGVKARPLMLSLPPSLLTLPGVLRRVERDMSSESQARHDLAPEFAHFWRHRNERSVVHRLGTVLSLVETMGSNFFHWMVSGLVKCVIYRRMIVEHNVTILAYDMPFVIESILLVLHQGVLLLAFKPHEVYLAEELLVVDLPPSSVGSTALPYWREITYLRNAVLPIVAGRGAQVPRLIIRDASVVEGRPSYFRHQRFLTNSEEVLDSIRGVFGAGETLHLGGKSLVMQIRATAAASMLVGVDGAGFSHIIFASDSCLFVVFEPRSFVEAACGFTHFHLLSAAMSGHRQRVLSFVVDGTHDSESVTVDTVRFGRFLQTVVLPRIRSADQLQRHNAIPDGHAQEEFPVIQYPRIAHGDFEETAWDFPVGGTSLLVWKPYRDVPSELLIFRGAVDVQTLWQLPPLVTGTTDVALLRSGTFTDVGATASDALTKLHLHLVELLSHRCQNCSVCSSVLRPFVLGDHHGHKHYRDPGGWTAFIPWGADGVGEGFYVQGTPHVGSRGLLSIEQGDILVYRDDLDHGFVSRRTLRLGLLVWLKAGSGVCDLRKEMESVSDSDLLFSLASPGGASKDLHGEEMALERAASREQPYAQLALGASLASKGRRLEAFRWFRRAAEVGVEEAQLAVSTLVPWEEARLWLSLAAQQGSVQAAVKLGQSLLRRGQFSEAVKWLEPAVAQASSGVDLTRYMVLIGNAWEQIPHSESASKALQWYQVGADAGDPSAMFNLGRLQRITNRDQAVTWLSKAAALGHERAQGALRDMASKEAHLQGGTAIRSTARGTDQSEHLAFGKSTENPARNIVALTAVDGATLKGGPERRHGLCASLQSAAAHGWTPSVLVLVSNSSRDEWDLPALNERELRHLTSDFTWREMQTIPNKPETYFRFLRTLQGDDLVFINDAFDVLYRASLDIISRAYSDVVTQEGLSENDTILYQAERNCYPLGRVYPTGRQVCDVLYRPGPQGARYLNSGGILGPRLQLLTELEAVATCCVSPGRLLDDQFCHQLVHAQAVPKLFAALNSSVRLSRNASSEFSVDRNATIWHSTHLTHECDAGPTQSGHLWLSQTLGRAPLVWHFNGNCKTGFRRAMQMQKRPVADRQVDIFKPRKQGAWFQHSRRWLKDLCPTSGRDEL